VGSIPTLSRHKHLAPATHSVTGAKFFDSPFDGPWLHDRHPVANDEWLALVAVLDPGDVAATRKRTGDTK
jgi:hypothetical protein